MAFNQLASRWVAALGVAAALTIAGCGGGDVVEEFVPTRYIAFGDDTSVIEADGRKYTINGVDTAGALVCGTNPIWIQSVAAGFGMAFAQCPSGTLPTVAETRAALGETVTTMTPKVDAFLANDGPKDNDLVTILVGPNDMFELIAQNPRPSDAELLVAAEARGAALAAQVNRIAFAGPAVVVSTIYDVGLTPRARAAGSADAALLTQMSARFNAGLRVNMVQDGTLAGIVFGEFATRLIEAEAPACNVALPGCTTSTLVAQPAGKPEPSAWLWADDFRPATSFHANLGSQALQRAASNPF